jgi:hypothetical protein
MPLLRLGLEGTVLSPHEVRGRLRIRSYAKLIAILNGDDDLLEELWSMDRQVVFDTISRLGISAMTGPTFSVYGEGPQHPASHNITMLHRHHRYCGEGTAAGLTVLPNLYWRGESDRRRWVDWLSENPGVRWLARDFSRTKQWACFQPEFDGLVDIVQRVQHPLHILATGIGEAKAGRVAEALRSLGSACCFVTARPIVAPPDSHAGPPRPRKDRVLDQIDSFRALVDEARPTSRDDPVQGVETDLR